MITVVLLDNDDSFTYNLKQLLEENGADKVVVRRTHETAIDDVRHYSHIVFSPGPALPKDFPLMQELLKVYVQEMPWQRKTSILGVCLGHQAIGEFFGATLTRVNEFAGQVFHGRRMTMNVVGGTVDGIFAHLPAHVDVGLYHSWMLSPSSIPSTLRVIGKGENGLVLAIQHVDFKIYGFQFHPESIITQDGAQMIRNWFMK